MTTIALITGANKGIGFETARLLGTRGMTVLAGARDEARGREAERALRAAGADARFVPLDVTDEKSVQQAAEWIDGEYGLLDILVNNAGIARGDGTGLPSQTTLATLRTVYETNVFGVVSVTNAMLPLLRRAPAARIVNVSSEVGSITSMTDPAGPMATMASVPYPSSKTALNSPAPRSRSMPPTPATAPPTSTAGRASAPRSRAPKSAFPWPRCLRTGRPACSGVTCGPPTATGPAECCPGNRRSKFKRRALTT